MSEDTPHYDDRLLTVLRFRVGGEALARAQWRQLVDLLGSMAAAPESQLIDDAYARLAELSRRIPTADRVAILSEPGEPLLSTRLLETLASEASDIAAAALKRADLSEAAWRDLASRLPDEVRSHRAMPPTGAAALGPRAGDEPPAAPGQDGIGAIVRRIEAYRKARESGGSIGEAPQLPLGDQLAGRVPARAFDFATDSDGRVTWADPGVAPMVVGTELDDAAVLTTIKRRRPLRAVVTEVNGSPAISGSWQVDAVPRFDPLSGRFTGYRGRMRRPGKAVEQGPKQGSDGPADRMRQLLHELRTPVNAIQGFAEIIQQQLFGSTPHEYRALAAAIAVDAARMLAAFDELDRLVRLDAGVLQLPGGGCDFAAIVTDTAMQLDGRASGAFDISEARGLPGVALAEAEAERIAWRVLATLLGTAAEGERLALHLEREGSGVRLVADLPRALATLDNKSLYHATAGAVPQTIAAGIFGVGFALRLAAAEVKAAGGTFERSHTRLRLSLPGASCSDADGNDNDPDSAYARLPGESGAATRGAVRPMAGIAGDGPVAQRLELAAHNG